MNKANNEGKFFVEKMMSLAVPMTLGVYCRREGLDINGIPDPRLPDEIKIDKDGHPDRVCPTYPGYLIEAALASDN